MKFLKNDNFRYIFYIILFSFFNACAPIEQFTQKIDTDLRPFYDIFMMDAHFYLADDFKESYNFTLKFDNDLDSTVLGMCEVAQIQEYNTNLQLETITFKTVKINTHFWVQMDYYTKQSTVYHELAHCLLNRLTHSETIYQNYPKSLMTKYSFIFHAQQLTLDYYTQHYSQYLCELFTQLDSCWEGRQQDEPPSARLLK